MRRAVIFAVLCLIATNLARAASEIIVSTAEQELAFICDAHTIVRFPVSTSKFGTGDAVGSYRTPIGLTFVSAKLGDRLAPGAVMKSRAATGEIVHANAPGRDAIVTRVIWLRGMDGTTANTRDRCIYIHGTPEESRIGRPASYGCVRMRSRDVIALYDLVHIGTHVRLTDKHLRDFLQIGRAHV